jgi:hypothetical protein
MRMERLLLLWDDLDDLVGIARHATLNLVGGVAGAGRGAGSRLASWIGGGSLSGAPGLSDTASEP